MSKVALILNGCVFNIIIADPTWAANNISNLMSDTVVDVTNMDVCIGYTYDGTIFSAPVENG
jgi:hypothetical protein